jgi:hypothetical protein
MSTHDVDWWYGVALLRSPRFVLFPAAVIGVNKNINTSRDVTMGPGKSFVVCRYYRRIIASFSLVRKTMP